MAGKGTRGLTSGALVADPKVAASLPKKFTLTGKWGSPIKTRSSMKLQQATAGNG